ncbi:MAG: hypothetical protein ABWY45_03475 [Mycobacterium sp.]
MSTLAVASMVVAPVRTLPEAPVAQVSAPVHLSAAVTPLTPQDFLAARADISEVAAELDIPMAADDITLQNSASDFVNWFYQGIVEWTDYFALELAPYVLQFLPAGWLITNQIYAIYPPIIDFTDSIVYDLIDPVLNDPLNLQVWANGIGAVAYTGVASLINVAINEVNLVIDYFLSWLPPLPPLPPWPFSAVAADATAQAATPTDLGVPQVLRDILGPLGALLPAETPESVTPATDLATTDSDDAAFDAGAQKLAAREQTSVPSEDTLPADTEPSDPETSTESDADDTSVTEESAQTDETAESDDDATRPGGKVGTRPATTERDDRDTGASEDSPDSNDAKDDSSPAQDTKPDRTSDSDSDSSSSDA